MKTKKRLLSILLSLALVLGLMPGMSLTAYAASYDITINNVPNGSVAASINGSTVTSAEEGATVTLTATPDNGYRLKSISGTYKGYPHEDKSLNGTKTITGTYFNYTATDAAGAGWKLANNSSITISSTSKTITKVEFNISQRGNSFNVNNVSCTDGTKSLNGNTLVVSSVNTQSITLSSAANNAGYVRFNSVKVYYSGTSDETLSISGTGNVRTFTMPAVATGTVSITPEFEEIPKYSVTYKVVGGTWSDGTTADKTETVQSGSIPASVPTGMKAASGYTGGAWDTNPAEATITGATTFTYTFTALPTYQVTYKVVNGTWSDDSTTDKTETVQSGAKPASVPTGMKAASGYTGGAWDTNPAEATITGATTFTYTFTALPTYQVTYKVVNGTWSDDTTTDKTETVQSGSTPASVPTGMKAASGYTGGAWDTNPADATITEATTFTYTFTAVGTISKTVTFKVVNGSWNDGSSTDKTVTLTGAEGSTLKLSADQIPAVGSEPNDGYTTGSWDVTPSTETAITADTTYTYTYAQQEPGTISRIVTFKVVNGSWNDESVAEKTVTLTGAEGTTLKLSADQIPAVGNKPNEGYKEGIWDTTPVADTEITANTTYTYTYAAKESSPDPDPTPEPEPEPEPTPEGGDSAIDSTGDTPVEIPKENQLSRDEIEDIIKQTGESVAPTDNIKLVVEANSKSASAVPSDEAEELNNNKEIKNGDVKIGAFVEIELAYLINNVRKGTISNPNKAVTFYVSVPASMVADGRTYFVYRIHKSGGTVTVTLVGSSSTPNVPVSSDEFSTYAIGYSTTVSAGSTTVSAGSSAPAHTHVYEWTVIKEATESDDGCMAYACKTCGATLYQVPISAYYVFNKSAMEQIEKAHQGATVSIVTDRWISFHKMVIEALRERPDVTLEISFLSEEYKGDRYVITIPAGSDLSYLIDENGFVGFLYLGGKYGIEIR